MITKEQAEWIHKFPIKPCCKCGSYNIRTRTPCISFEVLEGPVWMYCFDCKHKSPEIDCRGMSYNAVVRSEKFATKLKQSWNEANK